MSNPTISIVTVAMNSEKYIESAISSVLAQDYEGVEYIVIDGASTDKTVSIVQKYADRLDYFVSEKDGGIAEAMNKGVAAATGDYILFINSDDYLESETAISQVASRLKKDPDAIHIFKVRFLFEDGRQMLSLNNGLGILTHFKMGSCHQGQVIPRNLFNSLNGFDTSLSINFDYDWLLRAHKKGARSRSHDEVISVMRQVGISSRRDWQGFMERYREEKVVHFKNCDSQLMRPVYHGYWLLYIPYRFLRYILIAFNRRFINNKSIKALQ